MVHESAVEAVHRTVQGLDGVMAVRPDPPFAAIRVELAGSADARALLVRAIEQVGYQVADCDALTLVQV